MNISILNVNVKREISIWGTTLASTKTGYNIFNKLSNAYDKKWAVFVCFYTQNGKLGLRSHWKDKFFIHTM